MAKLRLQELRFRKGQLTQDKLAELANLSTTTISNLESDKLKRIELETISKLCYALNCTPNELFEIAKETNNKTIERQKKSLLELMGTIEYDVELSKRDIDADLAELTNKSLL